MLPEILETARESIRAYAGDDPDKWFYANRYVFARLQLDERKTKSALKRHLLEADSPCAYCGKTFDTKTGLHLHRPDNNKGYRLKNAVLQWEFSQ